MTSCGPGLHPLISASSSSSSVNLQHAIELLDATVRSQVAATTFEMSRTTYDPADYDGTVTTRFEIVASNATAGVRTVSLVDSSSNVVSTVSIPASTASLTRFESTFTPNATADNYRVSTSSGALNDLTVAAARIVVTQVGATRTKVYLPLFQDVNGGFGGDASPSETEGSNNYAATTTIGAHAIWPYRAARWSMLSNLTLEVVMNNGAGAGAALYDRTGLAAIASSEVTSSTGVPTLSTGSFSPSTLVDGHDYEVRMKAVGGTTNDFKGGLWLTLNPLTRAEAYWRVSRATITGATAVFAGMRMLLNLSAYTSPIVYSEVSGEYSAAGVHSYQLVDASTVDTGTSGSAVSGSSYTLTGTPAVQRSSALTLTSGSRMISQLTWTSGTPRLRAGFLVVGFGR